ncbi:hypothetical protein ENUP19_0059G0012 [Entamoeba nuttalli]|uniref:AP complex subunit sigma n=1 Tax=Entamoeba nuttalli TaxID=412467 RepID=A0ABQ0DD72_9EUKA
MEFAIVSYSREYNFKALFNNYEFYRNFTDNRANIIELLFNEYVAILSIVYKVYLVGVSSLSEEVIDRLLLYIDDWCLRDGILFAWDVVDELYEMALKREELEEEEEEYVFHWECEDSSLSVLDLSKL